MYLCQVNNRTPKLPENLKAAPLKETFIQGTSRTFSYCQFSNFVYILYCCFFSLINKDVVAVKWVR